MHSPSPTMCSVAETNLSLTTTTAPHHAGCKWPREQAQQTVTLALYEPSAPDQQRANDEAMAQAGAGVLMPFTGEPINAIPLSVVAPAVRAEPPWLRTLLLPYLRFRLDLPVYFIDEKVVTATDLDRQQNRFRLPSEGVIRNLRPVLSPLQRMAANLLHEEAPRPPKQPKVPGEKTKKRKGKKHVGLPVLVMERNAGISQLQLSLWDSSGGTVIKGEGYLQFINTCGFQAGDVVEIWAFFKETYIRLFGKDLCHNCHLCLLVSKKGQMLPPH